MSEAPMVLLVCAALKKVLVWVCLCSKAWVLPTETDARSRLSDPQIPEGHATNHSIWPVVDSHRGMMMKESANDQEKIKKKDAFFGSVSEIIMNKIKGTLALFAILQVVVLSFK